MNFKDNYGGFHEVLYKKVWEKHNEEATLSVNEMREYIWEHAHESRKMLMEVEERDGVPVNDENLARYIGFMKAGLPSGVYEWENLDSMSDDLVEHHYMNIRAVNEGSNFLKSSEREGFEAAKAGKAHVENPHPKGSQKSYHWTSGHKLGSIMKSRKMFKEDAVDDQLAKHGLSRTKLQKTVATQKQQFNGRPNPPQHAVKEGWAGDKTGENATNPSKRGMFKGRSLSSLRAQDAHVSGTKKKEVDFAIRAKTGWGKV